MVPESADTVGSVLAAIQFSCWDEISRPVIGLGEGEKVMYGGALDGPVILNGLESSGLASCEIVLRGGRLKKPRILTDLTEKKNKQFITLDKMGGLCEYLTGEKAIQIPDETRSRV